MNDTLTIPARGSWGFRLGGGSAAEARAVGEDHGAVVRDRDRVLAVRAARAVGAAQGPAVALVRDELVGRLQEPRLDRDDEPRLQREPASGADRKSTRLNSSH